MPQETSKLVEKKRRLDVWRQQNSQQSVPMPNLQQIVQRATKQPSQLGAPDLMALQQSMGNRAVANILQQRRDSSSTTYLSSRGSLNVSPANDRHEHEANQVAQQVAQGQPATPATIQRRVQPQAGIIQRQMIDSSYDDEIFEIETAKRQARVQDMQGGKISKSDPRVGMLNQMLSGRSLERQQQLDQRYQNVVSNQSIHSTDDTPAPKIKSTDPRRQMLNEHLQGRSLERQQQLDQRYQNVVNNQSIHSTDDTPSPKLDPKDSRKTMLDEHLPGRTLKRQHEFDQRYLPLLTNQSVHTDKTMSMPKLKGDDKSKEPINKLLREVQQTRDPKYIKRLKEISTRTSDTSGLKGLKMVSKLKGIREQIIRDNLLLTDKRIDKSLPEESRYSPLEGKLPQSLRKTIEFGYSTTTKESESKPGIIDTFGPNPEAQSYLGTATKGTNQRLLSQPTEHGRLRELTTPTEFSSMKSLGDTERSWPHTKLSGGPSGAHEFREHGGHIGPLDMIINAIYALPDLYYGTQSPPKTGWYNSEIEQKAVNFAQTKIDNEIATLATGNIAGPDSIGWKGGGWGNASWVATQNSGGGYHRWRGPASLEPTSIGTFVANSDLFTRPSYFTKPGKPQKNVDTLFNTHINALNLTKVEAGIDVPSLAALRVGVRVVNPAYAPGNTPYLTEPDVKFARNNYYLYNMSGTPICIKLIEYDPNYQTDDYTAVFRKADQRNAKYVVYTCYPT